MTIGTRSFLDLLSKHSNIELVNQTGLLIRENIERNGTRIIQMTTANDRSKCTWKATVYIDASYEDDLAQYSGVSYTWSRESRDQYGEPDTGVRPYEIFAIFLPNPPVNATLENGTLASFVSFENRGPAGSTARGK